MQNEMMSGQVMDEFSFALWTPGTAITLANVPWNNNYRDIVKFPDRKALNNYIDSNSATPYKVEGSTYHKVGMPVRLNIPFNVAMKYNYLRAFNPSMPIDGDIPGEYYYFITNVAFVAPGTTEFIVQLDVWQTFGYEVEFGSAYVERGHIGIANENRMKDYGRNYLTVPEGMDLGSDYETVRMYSQKLATARGAEDYDIMVTSTVALDMPTGDVKDPKFNTARGSHMENLPNGAEVYLFFSLADFQAFLEAYADKPWITQGIISIQAIPRTSRYGVATRGTIQNGINFSKVNNNQLRRQANVLVNSWRNDIPLPERFKHLDKFKTFPYTAIEMTCYNGKPLLLKPEAWNSADMVIVEVPHFAQPGPRLIFYPQRYNAATEEDGSFSVPGQWDSMGPINDGGDFLDTATGIYDFPTFTILNNGAISFMASNTNSLQYAHQSADWSQQKALMGANTSYDQASAAIGLGNDLSNQGINASISSNNQVNNTVENRALKNGVFSAMQAGTPFGAIGAFASNYANAAIETSHNNAMNQISTGLARGSQASIAANQAYNRDTNYDYAARAAQGDYSNTIAGIQAKVQDAQLIPPTTSGQVGGDAFNLANYQMGYDLKVKRISRAAMHAIGDFWLRYGYAVNRWVELPKSLMTMENFTYWKLAETYILSANCPESFKEVIRGIFESGVTVWKNPEHIGRIDIADNKIVRGIRY